MFLHKFPHAGIVHPEDDGNLQKLSPCASPPNRPPPEYKFPFHLTVSDGLPIYLRLRDEQQSRKAQPNLCLILSFQRLQTKTNPNTIVHPDPAVSTQQIQYTTAGGLCVWTPRNERRPRAIGRFLSPPSQGYQRHAHHRTPSPPSTCARTRARARGVQTACFIFSQGKPSPNPIHFPACALNCASNARIRASSLSALFCWRAAQWRPPSSSSSSSASRYGGGAKPDGL